MFNRIFKLRTGEEYITPEFLTRLETMLEESLPVFGNDPRMRIPLVQFTTMGFSWSIAEETGSEFIARRAEKAILRQMGVPDWSWRLRLWGWSWRCWRWVQALGRPKKLRDPQRQQKIINKLNDFRKNNLKE